MWKKLYSLVPYRWGYLSGIRRWVYDKLLHAYVGSYAPKR